MNKHLRKICILYTTAVCNLNCTYCFIDKNPALQKIDQYLDDSFLKTKDYYFNFAKEMFDQQVLNEVEFWGGEPFLGLHRAYDTIDQMINYFPNLKTFMASTNFVSEQFFTEFFGFLKLLGSYPTRNFQFRLQLSLDGPEYITDINRGKNVTKQIQDKFPQLIEQLQTVVADNVSVSIHFKPTLDARAIHLLQTKEAVLDYFLFFEEFQNIFNKLNSNKNITFRVPIPNTACPSPHTVDDGKAFANYCHLTREIEKENVSKHFFKYYKKITSFAPRKNPLVQDSNKICGVCMGHCGNGRTSLGLLPNHMVSCCHNGFVDLLAEYKKNVIKNDSTHMDSVTLEKSLFKGDRNTLIFHKDSKEFQLYQEKLNEFYDPKNTFKIANIASMIKLLALNGQIDSVYSSNEKAIEAAQFLLQTTSYCVRDNLGVTGSIYLYPLGLLKLMFNGAREEILKGEKG